MPLDMEAAISSIGEGLELGGSDVLSDGAPDSGGSASEGDLGDAAGTGGDLAGDALGGDSQDQGQGKEEGALDAGTGADAGGAPAFVAPQTWEPAAAAALAKADPLVQQQVAKREQDMFRGLEMYKQNAELGKTFHTIVQPYMPLLDHFKVDPGTLIPNLLEAHKTLSLGSEEQKMTFFRQLAADYGIPLDKAAAEAPYVDPEVARLTAENRRLQSERQRESEQVQGQARQQAASVLDAFIADPKNTYWKEVADDIPGYLTSGVAKTLQEAYDKAVWANPTTRAKEQARLDKERSEASRKAAEDKAAAARTATAANVRTSAKKAGGTAALGSMDDTITGTLKAIRARS